MSKPSSSRADIHDLITAARAMYRSEPDVAYDLAARAYDQATKIDWKLGSAEALLAMSASQHVLSNYVKAIQLANKALALFRTARNPIGVSDAHHRLAGLELERGEHRLAIQHANESLKIRRERSDATRMADTLAILTSIYLRQTELARALESALEGLSAAERSGVPRTLAVAYTNLGLIYTQIGYPEVSQAYLDQALEKWIEAKDLAGEAGGHYVLGRNHLLTGNKAIARRHLERALTTFRQLNERLGEVRALASLSEVSETKNKQLATEQLERALEIARQIDHPETLADVLIRLSRVYHAQNKRAKQYLEEALKIARSKHDLRAETEALELISTCYSRSGDYKKAFETLQLHMAKRLELMKHENSLEIKAVETRRELEAFKSQAEIHRLRAEDLALRVNEKEKDLSMLALHLVEKQAFIGHLKRHLQKPKDSRQSLQQLVSRLEKEVQDESGWRTFEEEFEQLSGGFFKVLASKHPHLTTAELKVCGLLRIGLSSKRIGSMLHISPSTVDTHRKHIRTKLALGDRKSLMGYLAGL